MLVFFSGRLDAHADIGILWALMMCFAGCGVELVVVVFLVSPLMSSHGGSFPVA